MLAPLLVIVAMLAMRRGFPIDIQFTNYRLLKNIFGLVPYATIAAGVGAGLCAQWLGTAAPRVARRLPLIGPAVAAAVFAVVIAGLHRPQNSLRPNYSRDAYLLGLSLPPQVVNGDLGLAGPGFGVYTLRWSGIGPIFEPNLPEDIPRSVRWERWPDPSLPEDYLLVSGPWRDRYLNLPGVMLEQRRGEAVLLRRAPSAAPK
jgi:hypothetical protein